MLACSMLHLRHQFIVNGFGLMTLLSACSSALPEDPLPTPEVSELARDAGALAEEPLEGEQELSVKDALKAAKSGSELIETIRKLRRIDTEQSLQALKLGKVISKVIRDLGQQAKNKGITITYTQVKGVIKVNRIRSV